MIMTYASLHSRLRGPISKELSSQLKIVNAHALPRIVKVVVNVGINRSKMEGKEMQEYIGDCLMRITGQKPVFTRSRKAISNFKIRIGMVVGATVTLRGQRMEWFLDRLLSYALPRVRDFRGVSTKFDGHGNYTLGIRDHSIFPEVPPTDAKQLFGLEVVIVTTAENDDHARALLTAVGMPFRKGKAEQEAAEKAARTVASSAKKTDTAASAS